MTEPTAWLTNIGWTDSPRYVVTYEGDQSGSENFPVYRHPSSDEELARRDKQLEALASAAFKQFEVFARAAFKLSSDNQRLLEALEEVEEYLDNRADADYDDTGFVPNTEMRLLAVVRDALNK